MKVDVQDEMKLRWPEGWSRTLIELRKPGKQWQKPLEYYRQQIIKELTLMGATSILIARATVDQERLDPGVAVWFSMTTEDYSWQTLLELPPAPTLDQIDASYRVKAKQVHPEGPKPDIEMFVRLGKARVAAIAWVKGTHTDRHEFVMALDRYGAIKWNMAGLSRALNAFRSLQKMGMPAILERVLDKAFKAALPMPPAQTGGEP